MQGRAERVEQLRQFIEGWLEAHGTNWRWLCQRAGVSHSLGTRIRQGYLPRPHNLIKLARAMGLSPYHLLRLAGYEDLARDTEEAGLTPEEQRLLEAYRRLDGRRRQLALEVLESLARPLPRRTAQAQVGQEAPTTQAGPAAG